MRLIRVSEFYESAKTGESLGLTCGDHRLDAALGLSRVSLGSTVEILGEPAAGKTRLCKALAFSALKAHKNVLVVDTEGCWDPAWDVGDFVWKEGGAVVSCFGAAVLERYGSNFYRSHTRDFQQFSAVVDELKDAVRTFKIQVLVIDSYASQTRFQSQTHQLRWIQSLTEIANLCRCAIIITNLFTLAAPQPTNSTHSKHSTHPTHSTHSKHSTPPTHSAHHTPSTHSKTSAHGAVGEEEPLVRVPLARRNLEGRLNVRIVLHRGAPLPWPMEDASSHPLSGRTDLRLLSKRSSDIRCVDRCLCASGVASACHHFPKRPSLPTADCDTRPRASVVEEGMEGANPATTLDATEKGLMYIIRPGGIFSIVSANDA